MELMNTSLASGVEGHLEFAAGRLSGTHLQRLLEEQDACQHCSNLL